MRSCAAATSTTPTRRHHWTLSLFVVLLFLSLASAATSPQNDCRGIQNRGSCERWFLKHQSVSPPRAPYWEHKLAKASEAAPPRGSTLVVLASCVTTKRREYQSKVLLRSIALVRENLKPGPVFVVLVSCRSLPAEPFHAAADAVLVAPCAAERGYDAGLWQQGVRYAMTALGDWPRQFGCVVLVNDSVLGPLHAVKCPARGILYAATWLHAPGPVYKGFTASSAATIYGPDALRSKMFVDYWNHTSFFCHKLGSMKLYEAPLGLRYQRAGENFQCRAYTTSAPEFLSGLQSSKLRLPWYKHKVAFEAWHNSTMLPAGQQRELVFPDAALPSFHGAVPVIEPKGARKCRRFSSPR